MEEDIAREREIIAAELRLASVRKASKASQTTVAKKLAVSQSNISQLERQADSRLSTVAGYIEALGGKLEVHAVFEDERVPLSGSIKNGKKNGQLRGSGKGTADKDPSKKEPIRVKACSNSLSVCSE